LVTDLRSRFTIIHNDKEQISAEYSDAVVNVTEQLEKLQTLLEGDSEDVLASVLDIMKDLELATTLTANQIPNNAKGEHYLYTQHLALLFRLMLKTVLHGSFPIQQLDVQTARLLPPGIAEATRDRWSGAYS